MAHRPDPPDTRPEATSQWLAGFFDAAWYAETYPDVVASGWDPLRHYVSWGAVEERNPNRWFDAAWYREHYNDVTTSGLDPLLHYVRIGAAALRHPHPRFDAAWYVGEHPEAAANPLLYHLRVGAARGWATEPPVAIADYLPSSNPPLIPPSNVAVDIIIPVYRGLEQTRRCILSVLADPARPPGRIIVVDDRSPEPSLSTWLDILAGERKIERLRNRQNRGFVVSANRGIAAAGTHDVVLLNSDTEVPPGWLARLAAQAYSAPRIASVSPFSNNATICGYPGNHSSPLPPGMTLRDMDAICQEVNAGRSVEVPTTVGFCMYIRREALTECGAFDEAGFGRGYGEENDFCRRTAARGWHHILACDTFVYHEGGVSFGDEVNPLSAHAAKLLTERYPDYFSLVSRHVTLDAVGPFRFAITAAAFRRSGKPTILLVSHKLGGGVRRHISSLVERLAGRANFLLLSATMRGSSLSVPALPGHPSLILPPERLDELLVLLRGCAVTRVHIHHLMGIDIDIRTLIRRLGVPFDVTVHDYFAICPQVNLLPWPELPYCGEPDMAACNACIASRPSHYSREILSWRLAWRWQFLDAERVFCPGADVHRRLLRHGLAENAIVVPHEPMDAGPWPISPPALRGNKLRVALLGVLANHKGAPAVAALVEAADPARLEIHLIGDAEAYFPKQALARIRATGEYEEPELPALLARIKPHVVWFPAPWPETYSYTLSTAIASGLPIVASRIGAFPERLEGRPLTWLTDPLLTTEGWLAVFDEVRQALRRPPAMIAAPPRRSEPDYYLARYLPPVPTPSPAVAKPPRRDRRRIVIVPERLNNGALSPCAYIRLLQPLEHLSRDLGFDLVLGDVDTALGERADVIVSQRYGVPTNSAADALSRHARSTGAVLLYDLDDDLLNIPADHPEAADLRPKAKCVQRMLGYADQVWVSSEALASRVASACRSVRVVANGLDERLWGDPPEAMQNPSGRVRILYMGTATHDADLALIFPALERIKQSFGDRVSIELMGVTRDADLPSWIQRLGVPAVASASYPGFVNWITDDPRWEIGLAPLAETAFNGCKSAIKTLDYAALGMAVLASDVPAYRGSLADGPGGMLVEADAGSWFAAISWLLRNPTLRHELATGARRCFLEAGTLAAQDDARRQTWMALPAPLAQPTAPARPRAAAAHRRSTVLGGTRPGRLRVSD